MYTTTICDGVKMEVGGPIDGLEKLAARFDNALRRQEELVIKTACRFDDESEEEFNAKVQRRLANVCMGIGSSWELPGITAICPGSDATWAGFIINRRRVDQLDNIYIRRAKA